MVRVVVKFWEKPELQKNLLNYMKKYNVVMIYASGSRQHTQADITAKKVLVKMYHQKVTA